MDATWWRHHMETFSALLAICGGNSPVPGEFPAQRPVARRFDVFFDLHLNKRLSKQSRGWWFETLSRPLWRHRNGNGDIDSLRCMMCFPRQQIHADRRRLDIDPTLSCRILSNYADPVYGVATICHQVRCLRWGQPSLFHTAMSLLIWYKMFCMRDISYRLIWMKYINVLSVYAQSGTHRPVNWWIIAVLT